MTSIIHFRVGQTFRDEAINFYYKNYPPPNIVYRPEKFSK